MKKKEKTIIIVVLVLILFLGIKAIKLPQKTNTTHKKWVERMLENKNPSVQRGEAKLETQNYEGAIQDFDIVEEMEKENPRLYLMRGQAKMNTQDYDGAIEDFDKVLQIEPNDDYAKMEKERAEILKSENPNRHRPHRRHQRF